jgi:RNA polymerase sigma-70 factor (ECF subfamily)
MARAGEVGGARSLVNCWEVAGSERAAGEAAVERFMADAYEEHGPAVLHLAARLCAGDRHRAEDVLQETMLRAWRSAAELVSSGRPLRPWLFTVARRVVIDQARARRARPAEIGDAALYGVPARDPFDDLLTRLDVAHAARSLSRDHRSVFVELYGRDSPIAEIASTAGVPAGTVKSRAFYALRTLRSALDERGSDEAVASGVGGRARA